MKRVAIFASGSGTNAEYISKYFAKNSAIKVCLILSNKSDAGVLERAINLKIPTIVFDRHTFYKTNEIINHLLNHNIDLIVLAGFLWLVPMNILKEYKNRIINIHPALLPKFGGKGMYGHHVHQAVINAKEKKSGITIHFVNEQYDEGQIIFQKEIDVLPDDTPDKLAARIHELEYEYFSKTIEKVVSEL